MRPPDLSGKKTKVCEFLREHPSRACTVLYMSTIAIGTWAPVKQQNFNPGAFFFWMRPGARMRPGRILCFPPEFMSRSVAVQMGQPNIESMKIPTLSFSEVSA